MLVGGAVFVIFSVERQVGPNELGWDFIVKKRSLQKIGVFC
jgi:hypothetical protein